MTKAIQVGVTFLAVGLIVALVDLIVNPTSSPVRSTIAAVRQVAQGYAVEAGVRTASRPSAPRARPEPVTPATTSRRPSTRERRAPGITTVAAARPAPGSAVETLGEGKSLALARDLYGRASYEDALKALPERPNAVEAERVELYRALNLIALRRDAEAEQSLARLVTMNPLFTLSEAEAAPRVVELFDRVRVRVLPTRIEGVFARAKEDLRVGRYAAAMAGFTLVADVARGPSASDGGRLAELGPLADEFLVLTRRQAQNSGNGGLVRDARSQPESTDRVYTMLDEAVKPPAELVRTMPPFSPPRSIAWRTFRGAIEVVVGPDGRVEQARMLERIAAFYDDQLVQAARSWTFRPALREGAPVRYRHRIEIVLRPQS